VVDTGEILLQIAHDAIMSRWHHFVIDRESLLQKFPFLKERGAVFVTLTKAGDLRGCIGSLVAHRPLIDDLVHNAQAAAFDDVRFVPVQEDELQSLDIEVSVLSKAEPLTYDSIETLRQKITIGEDGVILKKSHLQATFLPQVWEQLPTFELFFSHLCQKAGLEPTCLQEHPEILTYRVKKYRHE